jgi:diguanylate cyclase (GGDEF)-like protein
MNSSPETVLLLEGVCIAIENMPKPAFVIEPDGTIRFANKLAVRRFGDLTCTGFCALSALPQEAVLERVSRAFHTATPTFVGLEGTKGVKLTFSGWRLADIPGLETPLAIMQLDHSKTLAAKFLAVSQEAAEHRERLADSLAQQRKLRDEARRLQRLSVTDRMTGLLNAIEFRIQATALIEHIGGAYPGIAFAYVDLDNFKQINDRFGHLAGDAVIRMVARVLKRAVRGTDIVGRMGGDEFMVALAGASETDLAERVEAIIDQIREPIRWRPPDGGEACLLATAASVGVHSVTSPGVAFDVVLRAAEARMYERKLAGRGA